MCVCVCVCVYVCVCVCVCVCCFAFFFFFAFFVQPADVGSSQAVDDSPPTRDENGVLSRVLQHISFSFCS